MVLEHPGAHGSASTGHLRGGLLELALPGLNRAGLALEHLGHHASGGSEGSEHAGLSGEEVVAAGGPEGLALVLSLRHLRDGHGGAQRS